MAIKVVALNKCFNGHKVGEEWVIEGKTPEGICMSAFATMMPFLHAMRYGATLPYETDPDVTQVRCPDAASQVTFEIRRLYELK